jgi:hypothetical protein
MSEAEHRKPCESRGSRTVLGARGGEIPPRDSPFCDLARRPLFGRDRVKSGHTSDIAEVKRLPEADLLGVLFQRLETRLEPDLRDESGHDRAADHCRQQDCVLILIDNVIGQAIQRRD